MFFFFSNRFWICYFKVKDIILWWFLKISSESVVKSSPLFLKYICILPLSFLIRLTKGFVYFIHHFKEAALGVIEKVDCFVFSMSLICYLYSCTFLFILLLLFSITEFFNPFLFSSKWTEALKSPLSAALATVNKQWLVELCLFIND